MRKKRTWFQVMMAPVLALSLISPAYAQNAAQPEDAGAGSAAKLAFAAGSAAAAESAQQRHDKEGKNDKKEKDDKNKKRTINFVDPDATEQTKSLFAYLDDIRGKQILFGHQHDTTVGFTFADTSGTSSDVKAAVGDYPAIFGWDTLSLEGKEQPGVAGNYEQSRANLSRVMKKAHELGGIIALSAHMPNFVTGGMFNDTNGSVVEHILPGGDKNAEFNAYLDQIAQLANQLKDDKGKHIPILFRPFHEQNGSWFWWGAKTTTTSQYVEIFRYTVEYLRDYKKVHNFLYVYSPNGTFGGDAGNYLTTYPGDDYVDILGMDQYDNQATPGTASFLSNLVADLKMIAQLADAKDKIATFSEYGYSPQGMRTSGNGDLQWFTNIFQAIKSDPDARRISYMQTWANFNLNGNLFVPYRNYGELGNHELLDDFVAFYHDPYSGFRREVKDVYSNSKIKAADEEPFMHIVSPTDQGEVRTAATTVRARVLNGKPSKVVYSVEGYSGEIRMSLDADGFYSAPWSLPAELNGKTAVITVKAYVGKKVLEQTNTVFVKADEIVMKELSFSKHIAGVQNNGAWPTTITSSFGHSAFNGGSLKINVSNMTAGDTWQELKLELPAIAQSVSLTLVNRVKFDVWMPSSAGGANATLRGIVQLPPDWSDTGKYGMATTQVNWTDLEKKRINGVEYVHAPFAIDINNPQASAAATSLAVSIVGSGLNYSGPVYVDNIRLYNSYYEAPTDPALVDDFEGYQGSSAALGSKFVHAGGDATNVSLDSAHKNGGSYAMKLDYTLAGSGYGGRTKSLGSADWSGFNKLKFWLAPDGLNQRLVIQLRVDGVSYESYPSLASTEPGWVELHFNEFAVAPWDTANAGTTLNKVNLQHVTDFSVYVNAVSGAALTSSIYMDDIKAINDGTGGVPNGGDGPGSSPEQLGTLYDFESDVQGWAVEQNNAGATAPAITEAAAAKGVHSLTSSFQLAAAAGFELTKVQNADLSAGNRISAKVKLSNGSANVRLYIKTGPNWQWYDSGTATAVDAAGFQTLSMSLQPEWGLDTVRSMGIKVEPTSGTGTAEIYVDDVLLAAGD